MTHGEVEIAPAREPMGPDGAEGPMESVEAVRRDAHQRRCTATSSRSGKRCRAYAIVGGTVCRAHGGAAPQTKAKAAQRVAVEAAEADAYKVLAHHAVRPLTDPLDAMSRLAAEVAAFKDALAARVNALTSLSYTATGAGTEQLRGAVVLYERALDRTGRLLDMLAKRGWEERKVVLAERNGQLLAGVVQAILGQLGLTTEQQELVAVVVPAEFRKVAAIVQRESPDGAE